MPEIQFDIAWPDGTQQRCYSPSRAIKDHLLQGKTYPLAEFVARSRTALRIASARVQARYGSPCGRALGQLAAIEATAQRFAAAPDACVVVLSFHDL
jgi:uncharacterized repeat protein (TIGR04042 family)